MEIKFEYYMFNGKLVSVFPLICQMRFHFAQYTSQIPLAI